MELSNIQPKRTKLRLESIGKEYWLRAWTLADKAFMQEEYGDKVGEVLSENPNVRELCRVVYRLIEDKSDFVKKEVTIIDEDGEESVQVLGGYKILMESVTGMADEIALLSALYTSIGVNGTANKKKVKSSKR